MAGFKAAHRDISTEFTTDHREVGPDRRNFDIWMAVTDGFNETRHVDTRFGETQLPVDRPALVKVQGKPREPADLRGGALRYGPRRKSYGEQKTHRWERRPVGQEHGSRGGTESERGEQRRSNDPAQHPPHREHGTEPDRWPGTNETNQERRVYERRKWKQPEAGRRNRMKAGQTGLRGRGREGYTIARGTPTERVSERQQSQASADGSPHTRSVLGSMMAIAMLVGLIGAAVPAAGDELVSNTGTINVGARKLAEEEIAQSFRTGTNKTGYLLESISIDFTNGGRDPGDPVYVYLHEDNGMGSPDHARQTATLSRDGMNFSAPASGLMKYWVWERNGCCPKRDSVHLEPNTHYWVFIWAGEDDTTARVSFASSTGTGKPGWSLGDAALVRPEGDC